MCIKLFSVLGVVGIDVKDLDTAHRVPAREASNRPNAIICKFISRLTRDEVMARRNEVRNLRPEDLSFDPSVKVDNIRLYTAALVTLGIFTRSPVFSLAIKDRNYS